MKSKVKIFTLLTLFSSFSFGAPPSRGECESLIKSRSPSCSVERYKTCVNGWEWAFLRDSHVAGYVNDLNQNHGGDIVQWYRLNPNANPNARENQDNFQYNVLTASTGSVGSAAVFEADIRVLKKKDIVEQGPTCGAEVYQYCNVRLVDQACVIATE